MDLFRPIAETKGVGTDRRTGIDVHRQVSACPLIKGTDNFHALSQEHAPDNRQLKRIRGFCRRSVDNDIFLLRAAAYLPGETADRPGYVALLHGTLSEYEDVLTGNEHAGGVQQLSALLRDFPVAVLRRA